MRRRLTTDEVARARAFILSWDEASRARLRSLCDATDVVEVVGSGGDLGPALELIDIEGVDVVLADLDTAPGNPTPVIGMLRSVLADGRIVVWADDVTHFEDLFDAGVDAWITRQADRTTLRASLTGRPIMGSAH